MHYKKVLGDSTKQRRKFRKRRTKRRRTKRRRKSRKRRKTKRRRKSRTKKAGTYSPLARALFTKKMQEKADGREPAQALARALFTKKMQGKARRYGRELPQAPPAPPNLLDQMEGNTIPRTPKKNRKREREFRNRVGDGQGEPKAIKLLSLN